MCPHTAICVLILLDMCPDTAIYVSSAAAGHSILSSSCDATLRLWWREHVAGVGEGGEGQWRWKEVQVLTGHTASVTQFAVELAANGACYAASVGADSQLVVWRCAGEVGGGARGCHDPGVDDARWKRLKPSSFR
jgi:WD40 repeat protein